jgi:TPR repeat protein
VNYKKAVEWYEKAAKQGHASAQYNLGAMYENGDGVDQNDSMAMRWYAKAAAQEVEQAQAAINSILARRRAPSGAAASSASRENRGR